MLRQTRDAKYHLKKEELEEKQIQLSKIHMTKILANWLIKGLLGEGFTLFSRAFRALDCGFYPHIGFAYCVYVFPCFLKATLVFKWNFVRLGQLDR